MKIWFCKTTDLGGWLIRLLTFSQWNHVAIEIDGVVYDAMAGKGVRRMSAWGFEHRWDKAVSIRARVKDKQAAIDFLESQIGKPYDWVALLAMPFRTTWQSPHRWFCSELAAKAMIMAGHRRFNIEAFRVTPRDLWVALPGAEEALQAIEKM
ncbi:hypothetical protein [Marinobacter pelagius]|nr:hypothetical protein [Marinobacter pelagius]